MSAELARFFEKLFEEQNDGLVRFLCRRVHCVESARDIAQNAFMRIQKLENLMELENVKAYLYQVASNLAIDQKRRERLHGDYVQRELNSVNDGAIITNDSPESIIIAQRQAQVMENVLQKLPEKCRRAFLLHRVKGLSYSEIATEMCVSVSSVEKYILQSLNSFRQHLLNNED